MIINDKIIGLEMSTMNSDAVAASQLAGSAVEGMTSHAALQRVVPSAALRQNAPDGRPPELVRAVVIVFDDEYLKTIPGITRVVQLVFSLLCLIFVTSSGGHRSDYLQLPVSGLLRLLVFSCIAGFLLSSLMIALRVTRTINMFPINWNTFDLLFYSVLSLLFLISSSLAAHAVVVCQTMDFVSAWTIQQLTGGVVLGFICVLAFMATAAFALRQRFYSVHQHIHKFQLSQQSSNSTFVEQLDP